MWCSTKLYLGPIIIFYLYQWLAFCFQVFHTNSFCRWHKSFLYRTQSSWYCLPDKSGNHNNLFMGKANKLSLNIDKTNFMLFTPKRFSRVMDVLLIDGKRIMEVSETKFLGVIIDNKGIGIILMARKVFNHETLSTLYYTFVCPYLNYCIQVWGRAYNTHLKDLCVYQNKIIRIINGIPPRTNVDRLYIQQNILSVNRLYYYNIGIFMYKFSNSMLLEVFDSFFSRIEDRYALISYPSIFSKTFICEFPKYITRTKVLHL